ncbi:MAG: hypothetical protein ACI9YT_001065 [Halobacteriales archaeon]|jgi:hypothetical protein
MAETVRNLMHQVMENRVLADRFVHDPDDVLDQYDIDEDEKLALKSGDESWVVDVTDDLRAKFDEGWAVSVVVVVT